MRSRALPALGLSVVGLALATSLAPMASASAGPSAVGHSSAGSVTRLAVTDATCASNTGAPSGNGIGSQDFEAAFDAYDDEGAADFKLATKCRVKKVDVPGQFSAAGPVESSAGYIYKNASGKPGALKCTGSGTGPGPDLTVTGWKNAVTGNACKLLAGKWWVSVVAQLDFNPAGQWYWNTTGSKKTLSDMWQNPGGGFAICPSWDTNLNCIGVDEDYIFTVTGRG